MLADSETALVPVGEPGVAATDVAPEQFESEADVE
jgi:hypothetical protein